MGVVLGFLSGLVVLVLGVYGLAFLLAFIGLVLWQGPRVLVSAGMLTGVGLICSVLFARVALTCGGPLDPGLSECSTPDLTGWIGGSVALFGLGLLASALAFRGPGARSR